MATLPKTHAQIQARIAEIEAKHAAQSSWKRWLVGAVSGLAVAGVIAKIVSSNGQKYEQAKDEINQHYAANITNVPLAIDDAKTILNIMVNYSDEMLDNLYRQITNPDLESDEPAENTDEVRQYNVTKFFANIKGFAADSLTQLEALPDDAAAIDVVHAVGHYFNGLIKTMGFEDATRWHDFHMEQLNEYIAVNQSSLNGHDFDESRILFDQMFTAMQARRTANREALTNTDNALTKIFGVLFAGSMVINVPKAITTIKEERELKALKKQAALLEQNIDSSPSPKDKVPAKASTAGQESSVTTPLSTASAKAAPHTPHTSVAAHLAQVPTANEQAQQQPDSNAAAVAQHLHVPVSTRIH